MRTFIAIELIRKTKDALARLQEELKTTGADVNWVKPENIHLTLKFLSEVDEQKIPKISETLERICANIPSFAITLSETGVFPNLKFPRIIWINIKEGKKNTRKLINQIEDSFISLKFAKEKREPCAHITIGRVRSGKNKEALTAKLALIKVPPITQKIEAITIFKSALSSKGPTYEKLKQISLAKT